MSAWLVLLALGLTPLGCTKDPGAAVRLHTYPPAFKYLSKEQIQTTMGQFLRLLSELDAELGDDARPDAERQARVIALLREIDVQASALGSAGWPSNHSDITANVDPFRENLQRARFAAERVPPNYFWAGSLSAACSYCHSQVR